MLLNTFRTSLYNEKEIVRLKAELEQSESAKQSLIDLIASNVKRIAELEQDLQTAADKVGELEALLQHSSKAYDAECSNFSKVYDDWEEKYDILQLRYDELLAENHQLGLDAKVEVHTLKEYLELAKQTAEYWKLRAEANQKLADIYKKMSSI